MDANAVTVIVPSASGSSPRKRGPMITAGGYGSRLSLRSAGTTIFTGTMNQPAAVGNDRRVRSHCFRVVIYNERRNSNVSSGRRGPPRILVLRAARGSVARRDAGTRNRPAQLRDGRSIAARR
jgi:hypothetical protein